MKLSEEIKDNLSITSQKFGSMNEVIEVDKVITQYKTLLKSGGLDKLSPNRLSQDSVKLSILNINIGIAASEQVMASNMAYGFKKFEYAANWKKTKEAISMAVGKVTEKDVESELTIKNWNTFKEEMEQKVLADKLVALNRAIEGLLVAIGHRLKMLSQERFARD